MDVAEMTLDAYLDEWLAMLRMRIQPTTFRGYDDMIHAYLRWQDVDLTVPQLRVITSLTYVDGHYQLKSTKTGRGRVLTLDEDTAVAIARQPHPARDEWPLVFTRPDGMPLCCPPRTAAPPPRSAVPSTAPGTAHLIAVPGWGATYLPCRGGSSAGRGIGTATTG